MIVHFDARKFKREGEEGWLISQQKSILKTKKSPLFKFDDQKRSSNLKSNSEWVNFDYVFQVEGANPSNPPSKPSYTF